MHDTGVVFGSVEILGLALSGMKVKNIAKGSVPKFARAVQTARREYLQAAGR